MSTYASQIPNSTLNTNLHINSLEAHLSQFIRQALLLLKYDAIHAKVQLSARPELSQFQCNAAMPLAKQAKKNPFSIAEEIIETLKKLPDFENCISILTAIKPGFINLTLHDTFLAQWVNQQILSPCLGYPKTNIPQKIFLDFGGPNVAKPLHIGHLRSPLIGDCLQRVCRFHGDEVISDVHLGDWGTQMGMLIEEIRLLFPQLPYFNPSHTGSYPSVPPVTVDELSEIYPRASQRCKTDPNAMNAARLATAELQAGKSGYRALWRHFIDVSIDALKKDYGLLEIHFDLWKGESDVQPLISEMVQNCLNTGTAEYNEGAVIIRVAQDETDKTPPLILLKRDGAVMYGTTDLATILERRQQYQPDKILYVVDKRQSLHFRQVFRAADKTNIAPYDTCECIHIGFGTLNGPDGKPFKTRTGGVMRLKMLIDETKARARANLRNTDIPEDAREDTIHKIALATLKFADLSNVYTSDYIFDLDKFSQYEGKTGPYLLYSAVRIKSIMRKLNTRALQFDVTIQPASTPSEQKLQLLSCQFPNIIQKTYERYEPHHLCEYAYQLAVAFNKFYADSPILNEPDQNLRNSRIALSQWILRQLSCLLNLLGIEIPDRM